MTFVLGSNIDTNNYNINDIHLADNDGTLVGKIFAEATDIVPQSIITNVGTDSNFGISGPVVLTNGITLRSLNDNLNAYQSIEINSTNFLLDTDHITLVDRSSETIQSALVLTNDNLISINLSTNDSNANYLEFLNIYNTATLAGTLRLASYNNDGGLFVVSPKAYSLRLQNGGGNQTNLMLTHSSLAYNWMIGADFSEAGNNDFYFWDLKENKPALFINGTTENIIIGDFVSASYSDNTTDKVQILGSMSCTDINLTNTATTIQNVTVPAWVASPKITLSEFGAISITGGDSTWSVSGGNITIHAGNGGSVTGGDLTIHAGDSNGYQAGSVHISAGEGQGFGTPGYIFLWNLPLTPGPSNSLYNDSGYVRIS